MSNETDTSSYKPGPGVSNTTEHGLGDGMDKGEGYSTDEHVPMVVKSTSKSIGVRKSEILVEQYTNIPFKVFFLVSIFFVAFAYSLDGTIRITYQSVATSDYAANPLLSTVNVIKSVVAAAAQPTYARLSDIFGRLELCVIAILFYAIGTVIECQAYDIYRYAGGSVLYQIGYSGIILLLQVILADFSNLNWRLACSFIPALPFIIITWVSGDVASSSLENHSWNYALGIWAFIFPLACVPFLSCLIAMDIKARRTPEWKMVREEEKEINKWRSWKDNFFVDLFWRIDVIGVLLIICILGFILVPLTIAGSATTSNGGVQDRWNKASTIAPFVIGFALIPPFVLWEAKVAKYPVIPFPLLKDRGVWSALMIAILIDFVYYMPNDFMYVVLTAGMRASVKAATRISSLYSFVSVITGSIFGLFVTKFRRLKPFIMFGVLCWIGALAILFSYRGSNNGVDSEKYLNGIIGGLCFMGFGAGFFTYSTQVSIATCTNHEHMAILISLYLSFYNVGIAIGAAVSGAVWTNTLYPNMVKEMSKFDIPKSIAAQAFQQPTLFTADYKWGSNERIAAALAYADTQRILCIVGLVLCFPLLFATFLLRDHKLESVQSLELNHEAGIKMDDGEVVVNDYDNDMILGKVKGYFRRRH